MTVTEVWRLIPTSLRIKKQKKNFSFLTFAFATLDENVFKRKAPWRTWYPKHVPKKNTHVLWSKGYPATTCYNLHPTQLTPCYTLLLYGAQLSQNHGSVKHRSLRASPGRLVERLARYHNQQTHHACQQFLGAT